ncbi:hypothetical protein LX83_003239 [Goodfellowiella coeruleoviolacea]|uniref:Uncharacterized protein n=2 Tax=Goodfellowiella coeruleoviolacea TaxID=334858 RepID=A0AAE3KFH2_9PSEU|nr:hypothetical protein [Goodfellowiella coeruleoviolacea]
MVWTPEAVQAEVDYRWNRDDNETWQHVAEARRMWRLRRQARRAGRGAAHQADTPGPKAA